MSTRENAKRLVVDRMAKRRNLTSRRSERSRRPSIRWVEPLEDRIALSATPLGPQFLVNETLGVGENAPATAVLFNQGPQAGAFVIAWDSFEEDGSGYGVYGKVMKADGQFADLNGNELDDDTFLINSLTPGNQLGVSVASDASGNVLITWQAEDRGNGGYDVYCRRASFIASADGITGGVEADPEVLVNETLQGDQIQPAAAMDSAGNFVVTWQGDNADPALGREVYARLGTFGDGLRRGGTATAEFVVNDAAAGDQVTPSAAMVASGAGAGEFVVTWSGQVGGISEEEESTYVVLAKLFQADGTAIDPAGDATGEFQVSATVLHDQVVPVAAVNPDGTVVVAWQSEGGQATGADIHARRLDMTGQFVDVADLAVNQTLSGPQNAPAVAIAEDGRFVISWHSIHQDWSSRGVYALAYAADGSASDELQVNDLIQSGPQSLTGVAIGSDGRTVIVWLGPQVPEHGGEAEEVEGGHIPTVRARLFEDPALTPAGTEFMVNVYEPSPEEGPPATARSGAGNYVVVWESWEDVLDTSSTGIYAKLLDSTGQYIDRNGNGLDDDAFLVNTTTVGNQSFPTTTMDDLGNFVIAWQSDMGEAGAGYHIYSQRYDALGEPIGGETLVSAGLAIGQKSPAVAADSAGNYVIVWQGADASGTGIFARRYFADGTANGEVFQVNTFTDLDQFSATVAMNATGQFVVAWVSDHPAATIPEIDGEKSIFARWFDASGNAPNPEFLAHDFVADAQEYPAVGMAANGDFVVAWQSINQEMKDEGAGTGWGVYARQFSPDGNSPQEKEFRVNETVDRSQRYAALAVAPDGHFVIAWQTIGQDGSSWAIYQRQYGADGLPQSGEEIVNTHTRGPQILPAIAMSRVATGDYGIFWLGQGTDGVNLNSPTEGVHGRLYDYNDPPVGVADTYPTLEDTTLIVAAPGVLANDTDPEGNTLSAILVAGPEHGSLTLNADGSFTYTPAADYNGTDSFLYRPNDGTNDGDPVTVTIVVSPVPDNPTASLIEDGPVDEGSPVMVAYADPVDPDDAGATFRYSFALDPSGLAAGFDQASDSPSATFTFANDGGFTVYTRLFDSNGGITDGQAVVTVLDVAATIAAPSPQAAAERLVVDLDLGTMADPGADAQWTITVDWGDGSVESFAVDQAGTLGTRAHRYLQDGAFEVTVRATDARGVVGPGTIIGVAVAPRPVTPGDYDGDGLGDLATYSHTEAEGGRFDIRRATAEDDEIVVLGGAGDIPVAGDFDGDGKLDVAIFRPAVDLDGDGRPDVAGWTIIESSTGDRREILFGAPALMDLPAPADYDGDGKTDIATFRPDSDLTPGSAEWFILPSATGQAYRFAFGAAGWMDLPAPADYDGDGKTDIATFRPDSDLTPGSAEWFILPSATGQAYRFAFGAPGLMDLPVPADFDGDGIADIATFRSDSDLIDGAQWFVVDSATQAGRAISCGLAGSIAAIADYDGDSLVDPTGFTTGDAGWDILHSSTDEDEIVTFGPTGPRVVPVAAPLISRLRAVGLYPETEAMTTSVATTRASSLLDLSALLRAYDQALEEWASPDIG